MNRLGNRFLSILLSLLLVFPCFWIDAKPTAAVTLDLQIWFQGGGGRATLNYELTLHPTESPTLTESSTLGLSPELLPFDAQLFYREDGSGEGILFVRLLPGEDINGFLAALANDTVQVISQKEISTGSWELDIQWEKPSSLAADVSAAGDKTQLEVAYAGRGLQVFLLGRPRGAFVFFVPGQVSETNGLEAGENAAKFAPDIEPMRVAYLPGILPTLTESALPSETASATTLTPSSNSSESGTPSESATPPTEQNDSAPSESAGPASESFRETLPAAQPPTTQSTSLTSSGSIPTTTSTTPPPPAGFQLWLFVVLGVGILLLGMLIAVILMGRKRPPQPPADLGSTHRMDSAPPPSPSHPLDASQGGASDSRFCGKCGSKLVPDEHFCPGCGTPVA
jgi:hypothetical protein